MVEKLRPIIKRL